MHRPFFRAALLILLGSSAVSADPFIVEADSLITVNQTSGSGPSLNGTSTYDGVSLLTIQKTTGTFLCSGSLLLSGRHVLTAGHCLSGTVLGISATFYGTGAPQSFAVTSSVAHPAYTFAVTDPRDIGLLTLVTEVFGYSRYDINRGLDESGEVATLVGYGREGNGNTGNVPSTAGQRREASNVVDGYWNQSAYAGMSSLAFDFDNFGFAPARDTLGTCTGGPGFYTSATPGGAASLVAQTGVAGEGMIAPGDSGGPLFLAGLIAGVHSWGGAYGVPCGDAVNNSSWSDIAGDVRISDYADWLDQFGIAPVSEPAPVPEPATILLLAPGLVGVGLRARQRRNQGPRT
jgi:hypothetical protein